MEKLEKTQARLTDRLSSMVSVQVFNAGMPDKELAVEIEQSFRVPFASDQVWRSFHDTEGIVACLPGAALTAPSQDGQLKLSMTVKLGPIVAAFAGDGELRLDQASQSGSVTGAGSDRKSGSRVKGEAAFSLHDEGTPTPSTRVDVQVSFAITGALAQFSREGIVRELAERMTAAFSDNLKAKLEAESINVPASELSDLMVTDRVECAESDVQPPVDIGEIETVRVVEKRAPVQSAPLDLGGLFWPILMQRLRKLFSFGKKST